MRERPEDIPLLADAFLRGYRERAGSAPARVSPDAYRILAEHPWPGNVRELRNVVEAAAAIAGASEEIGGAHVAQVLMPSVAPDAAVDRVPTLAETVWQAESRALLDALHRSENNRARAARILGISQATLYRKLAKHYGSGNTGGEPSSSGPGTRTERNGNGLRGPRGGPAISS